MESILCITVEPNPSSFYFGYVANCINGTVHEILWTNPYTFGSVDVWIIICYIVVIISCIGKPICFYRGDMLLLWNTKLSLINCVCKFERRIPVLTGLSMYSWESSITVNRTSGIRKGEVICFYGTVRLTRVSFEINVVPSFSFLTT